MIDNHYCLRQEITFVATDGKAGCALLEAELF